MVSRIAISLATLLAAACTGTPGGSADVPQEPGVDIGADVTHMPETPAADVVHEALPQEAVDGGKDGPPDAMLPPETTDIGEETLDPTCQPGAGCFLDGCVGDDQCLSGWCVLDKGEGVCSKWCDGECPSGWSCKQLEGVERGVALICISGLPALCKPCSADADCKSVGAEDEVCLDYGSDGDFCGGACKESADCPWGFSCKDAKTVGGADVKQCVHDAGSCPCTSTSVAMAASTTCENDNEFGSCEGKRVCGADGLSPCGAAVPAAEACNGLDDDCDGGTDESGLVDGGQDDLCDDGNDCTSDSCHGADGCQHLPMDGDDCQDGDLCTVADRCVKGECLGTSVVCDDGNPCTDDTCGKTGDCQFVENDSACDDGNACTVGDACTVGACGGVLLPCDCKADGDCASLEDGNLCNGTLYCDMAALPYKCEVKPETVVKCSAPADGPHAVCQTSFCVPESGACEVVPDKDGFLCDDGDKCTVGDQCQAGKCQAGVPLNCADGNFCTDDPCDPAVGCVHMPNTANCNDGNACTVADQCEAGACAPGGSLSCDDGNPCTDDGCDPAVGCTASPNAAGCSDGDACTTGDHCTQGKCAPAGIVDCDDGNECTSELCDPVAGCVQTMNEAPCDDGDKCTSGDECQAGKCQAGVPVNCADGNSCTDDLCDPAVGCMHMPNTALCNDGNACTTGDHCTEGKCAPAGMVDCDDGNVCTTGTCEPVEGCVQTTNTAPCDDGDVCTVGDQCAGGKCSPGAAAVCDDGNACTDDTCAADAGCEYQPNTTLCDDGNACTLGDACTGGECVGAEWTPCDDGNACTVDLCMPSSGCKHTEFAGACDDGNKCTVEDSCSGGTCVGFVQLDCDDGVFCTLDSCDPAVGCVHVAHKGPCGATPTVDGGSTHACGVKDDGTVWCWGRNDEGQLGNGSDLPSPVPKQVAGLSGIVGVAVCNKHSCALGEQGLVWCWGHNMHGQLGDGTFYNRNLPVKVKGLYGVTAIAAGADHVCAVTADGGAECWGSNEYGQLGTGASGGSFALPWGVFGISNAVGVAAGWAHTCVLSVTGEASCWGANADGCLGDGTTVSKASPVKVEGAPPFADLDASQEHTCGAAWDGSVWCWGHNTHGELGSVPGGPGTVAKQVPVVSGVWDVALGDFHSCALESGGEVYCWGKNSTGQLGDGSIKQKYVPSLVSGLANVKEIGAGSASSCARQHDGKLWCWGDDEFGQLGNGTPGSKALTPVAVKGLSGVLAVAAGGESTCALLEGGGISCWGANWMGQLGNGTTNTLSLPTRVVGIGESEAAAVSIGVGAEHACSVLVDGSVRCWGSNEMGQLGDGTTEDRKSPAVVVGVTNAKTVSCGEQHSCATIADGKVYCWGVDDSGQLGDGVPGDVNSGQTTAAPVIGMSDAVATVAGARFTCAVKGAGTIDCWGRNSDGQLGIGNTSSSAVPVPVEGLSGVTAVAAGVDHACATTQTGAIWCWGRNTYGQVGNGTILGPVLSPIQLGFFDAFAAAAGKSHTCAVGTGGVVKCWGSSSNGQLGTGLPGNKVLEPTAVVDLSSAVGVAVGLNHSCAADSAGGAWCWGSNDRYEMGAGAVYKVVPTQVLGYP